MLEKINKIIYLNNLKKSLSKTKIDNLKKKFFFLSNTPYSKLSKKNKKHFEKLNIKKKDISVLKYTNYTQQLARALNNYITINKIFNNYKSVLDLGCGVGYFLYVNKFFKKKITGIDWLEANAYYERDSINFIKKYNKILNIRPINYKIVENFKPDIKKKFGLITAFSANFDGTYKNRYKFIPWNFSNYKSFFDKIENYLAPRGKFLIKFNEKWEYKKNFYIDKKFEKFLIKKKLWYGKGIVTNLKVNEEILGLFY